MENVNAMDEIHKGACMGMDALSFLLDKVEDEAFKKELEREFEQYHNISLRIEEIYPRYDSDQPHKTGVMTKMMTWFQEEMKTLTDHSNSNIAELLLVGVNMGIIEGVRILNHKKMDETVREIVSSYVSMQEKSMEILKEYL